ncbi:MAG TPA: ParB/RepB/Spo0J family partition protein [Tenuifilaceae bacterium]|nr:ParB/RepB/Spo0J family partition protein [Bacteroidales bacterium]MDI9517105.1 ParB/RepB/Spo0J family partition protein [Bacteroidota bacterium]NLH57111.1 ParB/RepB/Spo0J family partition protein [Rikenellaceae bacterium]OQC64020.1 MAG: putative chromosome-partitioning protein ParB [Bacteroidetes bacterium ADurb.Bin008]HNV82376.1 ParB/RepB/Spo0J family partition protein [Tenuifilaceae bacterium]
MAKKMALGRGLGALIEDAETPLPREERRADGQALELVREVDIERIKANPFQPRSSFDEEALAELAASIKQLGIIQPLTLRLVDGEYQLISGERRLRAAKQVGLTTVPAYIRTANDQGMLEMALVENIQREDLDAIEVAISYQRLIDECFLTHDNLSERVGKKRSTITNYLRLLKLPAEIQMGLKERKLSMGHARAIVSVENPEEQLKIYRRIIKGDLSVRQTEAMVRKYVHQPEPDVDNPETPSIDIHSDSLVEYKKKLNELFGWGADIKPGKKGDGKIVISYRSQGELEELMGRFNNFNG